MTSDLVSDIEEMRAHHPPTCEHCDDVGTQLVWKPTIGTEALLWLCDPCAVNEGCPEFE